MTSSKQLREQRANVWEQMKAIMAEPKGDDGKLSVDQAQTYDKLDTQYDELDSQIARAEAHELREVENSRVDRSGVVPPDSDLGDEPAQGYTDAFTRWVRGGLGVLDSAEQRVLQAGFVTDPEIKNAQGVGTGSAGGYTVPPAFRQKLIERMAFVAQMRQLAELITTETGATLPWPTVDDTDNEGAILAENTQAAEQDVVFGQADVGAYMYTSKLVRVSFQLLNDNAFALENWLARALAARIGRIQNRHFTVGTGTAQPDGIVTSATVGVTAASATEVTYDELVDLSESLDEAYLQSIDSGWMFNQAMRKGLRKLKDGNDRPIWEPSMTAGSPATLLGYPTRINNHVPVPAIDAKTIVFGDVREAYLIRDVQDFTLLRLSERYADFLQVGFIGFQRSDGTLQNAAAVRTLQQAAA